MTAMGRLDASAADLASDAAVAALADAGVAPAQLGMIFVSNALGGGLCEQESIRGQAWLSPRGTVPVVNVDNACAGGATALHLAWLAVEAGVAPVLVVGVEKMFTGDRAATLRGIEGALPAGEREWRRAQLEDAQGSVFMALNATWARRQIAERGAIVEHFAAAAAKARAHGALNPKAQHRTAVSACDVLASPVVAAPLTRLMCSSFTDGAAAVVLGSSATRRATGVSQVVELVEHVRGSAGRRQVDGARVGMAVNTGGIVGPAGDVASFGAHVIGR